MSTHDLDRGPRFWMAAALLAGISGALLTPGCDGRDGAAPGIQVGAVDSRAIENDVSDLQQQLAHADRSAQRQIEQARASSRKLPVAARDRLADAIERTEVARDEAGDRLDELKRAGAAHWEARRERVVEALGELDQARHDVVAALAGGKPSLSGG